VTNGGKSSLSYRFTPSTGSEASHGTLSLEPMWEVPTTFTPLFGREQEVATICALLKRPEVCLLTLVGVGGIGKTRLSLEVTYEMREFFVDGVCFVHLASVSDPELVIPTIAQALGIQEIRAQSIFEQMKVALRDKRFLLLLDNFEQVVMAAPLIEELLGVCHDLKIMVTSRWVLHVQGEQEFPVLPLSLPDLAQVDASAQSASMALFVQRAQSILPNFQITPENARAIAEICVRLDGLPLAIELAAARVKLLPPQALLSRLSRRLQLLTGGLRSFPERHQTLRNAIKWSYDLLDDQEQQFFRRISVFVGGWTLEAVETVWNVGHGTNSGSLSVLDGVASLLEKSLLLRIEQAWEEEPRFSLLETVREYALEALHESGEAEVIQRTHALYYLRLVEEVEPHLKGAQHITWLAHLEREQENLRAALGWLIEQEEAELALRFCRSLWWFWRLRGYWSEGRRWLEAALGLVKAGKATEAHARALCAAGDLAYYQDDYVIARSVLEEAVALCRTLDLESELATALCTLGVTLYAQGDVLGSRHMLEESEALCRTLSNIWQLAYVLRQSGLIALHQGNIEQAAAYTQEALALVRELDDNSLFATILSNLGGIAIRQGDLIQAVTIAREALTLARELGDKSLLASMLQNLGYLVSLQGDLEQAATLTQEGLSLFRELGDRTYITIALHSLGYLTALQGDLEKAEACYREGLSLAQEIRNETRMGWHLVGLASIASIEKQPIRAARLFGAAEMRLDVKAVMNTIEREDYERGVQSVRSLLGEKSFAAALAEGQIMTPEQILAAQEPESLPAQVPRKPQVTSTTRTSLTNPAGLTVREVEVLRLVAQGLTDAQVAEQLVISPRTVNWHLTTIYSKLQISSRSAATRFAIEQHLV
jgi:predicted ATPase/DNA-binding CsgD family transcriptional regulator